MKMRICITLLLRWKYIFFHNSSSGPLLVGRLRQSAATKRGLSRSPELSWHSVAPVLNNNHFRDDEDLEDRLCKDTEIKVKTRDGLDKDTVHPGGTPKEEGGGRKKGVAIL